MKRNDEFAELLALVRSKKPLVHHITNMRGFGVTPEEVAAVKPSLFNRTYTANILAVGLAEGLAEIMAAVFPYAWTYHDYACRLKEDYADKLETNFYRLLLYLISKALLRFTTSE